MSKLYKKEREYILTSTKSVSELADKFGVSKQAIYDVLHGKPRKLTPVEYLEEHPQATLNELMEHYSVSTLQKYQILRFY